MSLPLWAEALVALLLVASGLASLTAAFGMLRLPDFFSRMHPPALASTLGTWCVALASIVFFSLRDARLEPYPWLIVILLAITAPVTTVLLARAALFRERQGGRAVPPPLSSSHSIGSNDSSQTPARKRKLARGSLS